MKSALCGVQCTSLTALSFELRIGITTCGNFRQRNLEYDSKIRRKWERKHVALETGMTTVREMEIKSPSLQSYSCGSESVQLY